MTSTTLTLLIGAFLASAWATGWFRRYALSRQLLDVPNVRSSHVVATPRGAGVAFAATTLLGLLFAASLGILDWTSVCGLVGGGLLVGGVGCVEDHREMARRWRLLAHVAAAAWVLYWMGGTGLPLATVIHPAPLGYAIAVLYLAWLINLTNFMDGIDGIAAIEAITVCLGAVALSVAAVPGGGAWIGPALLASTTAGFLVWNWPPAKVFMGDAGSGFLGIALGALGLQAALLEPRLLWSWLILLAVFIVDATVTLARRILRGQRFYEAHRTHAYQHAAQRWTHRPVTLAVAAINVCWLLPLAFLVASGSLGPAPGLIMAYSPLVILAMWLKAGMLNYGPRTSRRHPVPP